MTRIARTRISLGLVSLVLASSIAANPPATGVTRITPKWRVLTGEIVDMGCYTSRGLKGGSHRACGTQCVRSGVPRGLLAAGDTLYVLTENHDRAMAPTNFPPPNPFALCGDWVSLQVQVSGLTWEKGGTLFLEVRDAKLVPPPEAAP